MKNKISPNNTSRWTVWRTKQPASSEKIISLMKRDGFRPATAEELLRCHKVPSVADEIYTVMVLVALGTVLGGRVGFLYLDLDGSHRPESCSFDKNWGPECGFLAVSESSDS